MIEIANTLLAIAGIATTLAGFSGLLLAFRSGRTKLNTGQNIAIRVLMMTGISAMIFALVPVPLLFGGVRPDILWAGMLSLLGLHFLYFVIVVPRDLYRKRIRMSPRFIFFMTLHATIGCGLLAGAFDLAGMRGPSVFMAGLIWLIVLAAIQLLVHIFGILAIAPQPMEKGKDVSEA